MPVKTVVELDLVGYSTISAMLEDGIDVGTVAQLNEQIQGFVDVGLRVVGAERNRTVMQTTGDGAILIFDRPMEAHGFAAAVHEVTRNHNRGKHRSIGKRVFRVGVATGEIHMCARPDGGHNIAGMVIARAVRLEAKAPPGGVLVDEATFAGLTPDQQQVYAGRARVEGKRDEMFDAWRCVLNPDGAKDAAELIGETPAGRSGARETRTNGEFDERLPEDLLHELLRSARVAEAPPDLERALQAGLAGVAQKLQEVDAAARSGLELDHVLAVVHEAIGHGAGIYNHSATGRLGCGRIYHRAATGLTAMILPLRVSSGDVSKGAYLAIDWLERIVKAVPKVTPENGDDLAWELRFAFDSMPFIPLFDSVTYAVSAAASSPDAASALCQLLRQVVEKSRDLPHEHAAAYLLQHTARVLLQHREAARMLGHSQQPLRQILDDHPRITRQSGERLVQRLRQCFVQICQNVEAGQPEPQPARPGWRWWPFGN